MPRSPDDLTVGGLKVSACEDHYKANYVGYYSIPGVGDGPYLVFHRPVLDIRETDLGFDNYFGLYRHPLHEDEVRIFNAKKIRDAKFSAIEVAPGEYICSRSVHNMVSHPSGAWLDGGPFYSRLSPSHPITHVMQIVDGKEVFTKVPAKVTEASKSNTLALSMLPSAHVGPAVIEVIDAEFTEVTDDYTPNGMTLLMADVGAFHTAVDQPVRSIPKMPTQDEIDFRIRLIDEEYGVEFKEACLTGDIVGAADALTDIIYVVLGTAHHFGIPMDRCWQEVQSSNMAKVDSVTGKVRKRADGKVLKPEGWKPPNIPRALGLNVDITV
jgi:predicted HAD superfamily Cof-like phosphohydrolase